jgi:5'-AMP-activated protein kinase catalytic alpha subunit
LLDEQQNLKIADFGLANIMKAGQFCLTSCGSPNYAAPELISGAKYCGSEVDIWSTGVVLYALLAGCLPFDEPNIADLFIKIKTGVFKVPRHFSPSARDLVMRMLNTDPVGRITIAQIKNHPWYYHNLPNYISISDLRMANEALTVLRFDRNSNQIDEEVFMTCRQLEKFRGRDNESLKAQLSLHRDGSFSACYEIMMTDKYRHVKDMVNSQSLPSPIFCSRKHAVSLSAFAASTLDSEAIESLSMDFKPCENWRSGIKVHANVLTVVRAIHNSLQDSGYLWKTQGSLHFRIKSKIGNLKFDVILYSFELDIVVDLELKEGHYLHFMSACDAFRRVLEVACRRN